MVSVVLHNACLRMEEQGVDVDDIVTPKGLHRWLGRSGIALGGAASILVGAVFGGILEGIPVLLPPPAVAASAPLPAGTGLPLSAVNPWSVAASVLPAAPAAPPTSVPNPGTLVPAPGTNNGGGAGCGLCLSPLPGNPTGPTPTPPAPPSPTPTTPVTTSPPPSGDGSGSTGLVQTVTGIVSNPTSVVTNPTGTVTSVVQGVQTTTSTLTSPTSSTSSSSSLTTTTVNTVSGTTSTLTSSLGL